MRYSNLFLILFLCFIQQAPCAKILAVFHMPSISHYRAGVSLVKILANAGHEVTLVSPIGEKNPPKNYRDIILHGIYNETKNDEVFFYMLHKKHSVWMDLLDSFLCTCPYPHWWETF
ncbi:hypothetical protein HHI36_011465 [Cryptolaemus montrouzieri]|uniref:Uncharacterized protein n=1 Tax=Cryptolaemus montrouzieri TaxID=559131 RepID=A0ABD2MM81_9CUCU